MQEQEQEQEREQFGNFLMGMASAFDYSFTPEKIKIWWEVFKDYDYETLKKAGIHCMKTQKFMPRISDLLKSMEISGKIEANAAWAALQTHLSRSECGDHPITNAVVRLMGGPRALAMVSEHELKFKQKQFIDLYEQVLIERQKFNSVQKQDFLDSPASKREILGLNNDSQ